MLSGKNREGAKASCYKNNGSLGAGANNRKSAAGFQQITQGGGRVRNNKKREKNKRDLPGDWWGGPEASSLPPEKVAKSTGKRVTRICGKVLKFQLNIFKDIRGHRGSYHGNPIKHSRCRYRSQRDQESDLLKSSEADSDQTHSCSKPLVEIRGHATATGKKMLTRRGGRPEM